MPPSGVHGGHSPPREESPKNPGGWKSLKSANESELPSKRPLKLTQIPLPSLAVAVTFQCS
jgi:hypothetical protein